MAGAERVMLSPPTRRVLLLQGPPTPFFSVLERAFVEAGVPVRRVLLNAGDSLRAGRRGIPFRGTLAGFEDFLEDTMLREGITDVLYFADRVPYHRLAEEVAGRLGAIPYAIENGYLRPDWLTLEPGGMGAFSRFPADRTSIMRIAEGAPAVDEAVLYGHAFPLEAWYDVSYNLVRLLGTPRYPHFEADRPQSPVLEYVSWLPQLVRRQVAQARAPGQLRRLVEDGRPFFFLPLQLQEDYQIRHNSPWRHLPDFLDEVLASFARAAPDEAKILVKIHPLDNGLQRWPRTIARLTRRHGLAGRVVMLSAGSLTDMLGHCRGVVLVNSTVGVHALRALKPTKTLGVAVYDMDGLTDPQPLDGFWSAPRAPEPAIVDAFVRALARATQLKGSFYDPEGMRAGAAEIVARVIAGIGAGSFFEPVPPRLPRARAMGVAIPPPLSRRQGAVEHATRLW